MDSATRYTAEDGTVYDRYVAEDGVTYDRTTGEDGEAVDMVIGTEVDRSDQVEYPYYYDQDDLYYVDYEDPMDGKIYQREVTAEEFAEAQASGETAEAGEEPAAEESAAEAVEQPAEAAPEEPVPEAAVEEPVPEEPEAIAEESAVEEPEAAAETVEEAPAEETSPEETEDFILPDGGEYPEDVVAYAQSVAEGTKYNVTRFVEVFTPRIYDILARNPENGAELVGKFVEDLQAKKWNMLSESDLLLEKYPETEVTDKLTIEVGIKGSQDSFEHILSVDKIRGMALGITAAGKDSKVELFYGGTPIPVLGLDGGQSKIILKNGKIINFDYRGDDKLLDMITGLNTVAEWSYNDEVPPTVVKSVTVDGKTRSLSYTR